MTITVWPVDAVSGAPEYTGSMARQAMAATLFGATSARPLGARSGVRIGTPTDTVSVSGSTVTIKPHAGILDLQASAAAGPYWYAIDANETETLDAAHSTHPRIDIITVRIDDPAESDGTTDPAVVVVYKAGTAASSPTTPTPDTTRELIIATIAVPASGGGDGVASWVAPYAGSAGGIIPVRTTTERDALAAAVAPTTDYPLYVHRIDATAGLNLEVTRNGTDWEVLPTAGSAGAPYVMAAGSVTVAVAAASTGSQAVVFPVSRFGYAPIVTATASNSSLLLATVLSVTTAGCTVTVRTVDGSSVSGSYTVGWIAVQMLSSAAAG